MTDNDELVRGFRSEVPPPDEASWAAVRTAVAREVAAELERPHKSARMPRWRTRRLLAVGLAALVLTGAVAYGATTLIGVGSPAPNPRRSFHAVEYRAARPARRRSRGWTAVGAPLGPVAIERRRLEAGRRDTARAHPRWPDGLHRPGQRLPRRPSVSCRRAEQRSDHSCGLPDRRAPPRSPTCGRCTTSL